MACIPGDPGRTVDGVLLCLTRVCEVCCAWLWVASVAVVEKEEECSILRTSSCTPSSSTCSVLCDTLLDLSWREGDDDGEGDGDGGGGGGVATAVAVAASSPPPLVRLLAMMALTRLR